MSDRKSEEEITRLGNPAKPQGSDGESMLTRMNKSHNPVTTWALDLVQSMTHLDQPAILDLGCGGGATIKQHAERNPDASLYGIDYSETSVKMTEEYNQEEVDSGKLQVTLGSVEKMPYKDNSFDLITTVESFYFWPNPLENLKEVRRVLKEGGTFHLIADIYGKDDLPEKSKGYIEEYNLTNPTIREFADLFDQAGFSETTISLKKGTDWICVTGKK